MSLDSFFISGRPQPQPLATSQEIRDRGSVFIATIYAASTPAEAAKCIVHLSKVAHAQKPASHEMNAFRCMVLKDGRTGLGGPDDFEVREGSADDGERHILSERFNNTAAFLAHEIQGERSGGEKILAAMRKQGVIDAAIVVSRWYGGTLLGPARFSHIETCTLEVCREFKRREEVKDALAALRSLDDILAQLRDELAVLKGETASAPVKKPDYSDWIDWDLPKARRLIRAREGSINSVKALLLKHKQVGMEQ
ncbi:Ribosomal protein S5 domain 2-like protein [Mycena sanguinolenta]|uniref:Ribosomal protein S5 domain 2-like protein n=1 Tax=Mycena sanguinolenta TaxID=230812 RepID=A0A8H6Y0S5_9AGAR|nr:Ribosomal protein S5 domain 2-like protein [Mycena sanguinolenta]